MNKHLFAIKTATSLAVQWLRLHPSNAQGIGLIIGLGKQIPHTVQARAHAHTHTHTQIRLYVWFQVIPTKAEALDTVFYTWNDRHFINPEINHSG